MKKFVILMTLLIAPMLVMAQVSGGQVTRPPKKQTTVTTPSNNNNRKKNNTEKKDKTNNRVNTPPQKEEQPEKPKPKQEVEAAGYDVTFTCNVPSASMTIDGVSYSTANGTQFLKTGDHVVNLTADGYEDFSQTISVNSKQTSFSMTMTEKKEVIPSVLKRLMDNMVYVEGGTFTMGATTEQKKEAEKYEKPAHQVTLSSFSIGKFEVTQEEWEMIMGSNPSMFKGAKLPVEQVSWKDCQEFIRKLNHLTGKKFRLPTEAEWEYAARGGKNSFGYKYAGSNSIREVAWFDKNSNGKTHEVGLLQPNELGIYDMSGNVLEWCSDWYGKYVSQNLSNPTGASFGSYHVFRGGSYDAIAWYSRISFRGRNSPDARYNFLGLRLAL